MIIDGDTLRVQTFAGRKFRESAQKIGRKSSKNHFPNWFRNIRDIHRKSRENSYFREKKLSRIRFLEFLAELTFANLTKIRENRENFLPRKFVPLKYAALT